MHHIILFEIVSYVISTLVRERHALDPKAMVLAYVVF